MSTYQGACGTCGSPAPILPTHERQLSGTMRTNLLSEAVIFQHQRTTGKTQFASAADYMRYKKARVMAATPLCTAGRPPQSVIIENLIVTSGCSTCDAPIAGTVIVSEITSIIDSPYLGIYTAYFDISWTPFIGATTYSYTTDCPSSYVFVSTGSTSVRLYFIWNFAAIVNVTITATNTCGTISSTGSGEAPCFLAGSQVTMADMSTKSIEDIQIGDKVLGAFGEINTVLALHRPFLGTARMCLINNDHSTSSHHPHISPDRRFFCAHPATVIGSTYGKEHDVITDNNKIEKRMLYGLHSSRIELLEIGQMLQTVNGARNVESLEIYDMPSDTQLYNLVVGGSHTYCVDSYAVTGWPREDDFDYDTWKPRM